MPTRPPPVDLELVTPLIPYQDLQINGDPGRNLRIGTDIIMALAGMIGIQSNGIPRLAHLSHSGALFVTEAGGGVNDVDDESSSLAPNQTITKAFPATCNPVLIAVKGSDITFTSLDMGADGSNVHIMDGFQRLLPMQVTTFQLHELNGKAVTVDIQGFFFNATLAANTVAF